MPTECSPDQFGFTRAERRTVVASFDGDPRNAARLSGVERETNLERHLILDNRSVRQVTADLHDLEPLHIAECRRSSGDGVLDRVGDTLR